MMAVRLSHCKITMIFELTQAMQVIIAMNRLSPTFATKDANPAFSTAELPALSASSDVTWGLWQYAKPGKLENPRFFFSASITNEQTLRIISRALANDGKALEHWPGATFLPNEEDFRALLGKLIWMKTRVGKEKLILE